MKYARLMSQPIPQTQPLNERQVKNNAGGFVYQLDCWSRLNRFLILGSDSSTYYQKAVDLTRENAKCVLECIDKDARRTVQTIIDVSHEGRAPKNDPAIFALALFATHKEVGVRAHALNALPRVCRTATHLFQYLEARKDLKVGKGGRALHRAIENWYNSKSVDSAAYQMIKYRERNGWSHKSVHQLHHPSAGNDESRRSLYQWVRGVAHDSKKVPPIVTFFEKAQNPGTTKATRLTMMNELPWEALPTECLSDPDYWAAMLPRMPLTALVRNLGNMSRIGLIKPLSAAEKLICERLGNEAAIKESRLHPFNILVANKTYASGHGFRGDKSWDVSQRVVDALDGAFYKGFKNVEPTGKRFLFGLDVSGSMSSPMQNTNVRCCEATAALSLVTANVEPQVYIMGFANTFRDLKIRAGDTLEAATKKAQDNNFGSTDCAVAIKYAYDKKIEVDVFTIMTDNETYAGGTHVSVMLNDYRKKFGINSKLIVVGMTSTGFTIGDPNDAGTLNVAGFDTSVPVVMAEFARA